MFVLVLWIIVVICFCCETEEGLRDFGLSRGLSDVYKRRVAIGGGAGRRRERCSSEVVQAQGEDGADR